MAYRITGQHENGAVNAEIVLTFTAGSEGLARMVAAEVVARLTELAGTVHVPAVAIPRRCEHTTIPGNCVWSGCPNQEG